MLKNCLVNILLQQTCLCLRTQTRSVWKMTWNNCYSLRVRIPRINGLLIVVDIEQAFTPLQRPFIRKLVELTWQQTCDTCYLFNRYRLMLLYPLIPWEGRSREGVWHSIVDLVKKLKLQFREGVEHLILWQEIVSQNRGPEYSLLGG